MHKIFSYVQKRTETKKKRGVTKRDSPFVVILKIPIEWMN